MHIADHGGMLRCSSCSGFVPTSRSSCPHCGTEVGRPERVSGLLQRPDRVGRFAAIASTVVGSAFTMTLMACYGCPPSECTFAPDDAGEDGRVRSDAQVVTDAGLALDAATLTDGSAPGDGGTAQDGGQDAGDSFDATPE